MSQQGGRPTGHEDDWWRQLYDDSTEDTGATAAADSLDDRFASAAGTVGGGPQASPEDRRPPPATQPPTPPPGPTAPPPGPPPTSGPPPRPTSAPASASASGPPPRASAPAPASTPPPRPASAPASPPAPTPTVTVPAPRTEPADEPPSEADPDPRDPRGPDRWLRTPWETPPPPTPALAPASPAPATAPEPVPAPEPEPEPATTAPEDTAPPPASAPDTDESPAGLRLPPPALDYIGSGPPTYDPEPTALPPADPDGLDDLVPDTVLDGARYGACTLRAVSLRGDSARYRGEPRRDALLTARFGSGEQALVLVAMATGTRAAPAAHLAAAEACQWIARAVGRSHARLVEDIRAARRGDLKSGLHRLTDRSLGRLRAGAAEQGVASDEYAAGLRCLLLPADPECRTRVFFGAGEGGLFRLRDGEWQDIEPRVPEPAGARRTAGDGVPAETPEGDRLTMDLGITTAPPGNPYEPDPGPPPEPFRFRASVARPGDALLMCTGGLADPLRGEPELCAYLGRRWSGPTPPGLAAFLADSQVRVKGYSDDRTAAAVWEA